MSKMEFNIIWDFIFYLRFYFLYVYVNIIYLMLTKWHGFADTALTALLLNRKWTILFRVE